MSIYCTILYLNLNLSLLVQLIQVAWIMSSKPVKPIIEKLGGWGGGGGGGGGSNVWSMQI